MDVINKEQVERFMKDYSIKDKSAAKEWIARLDKTNDEISEEALKVLRIGNRKNEEI